MVNRVFEYFEFNQASSNAFVNRLDELQKAMRTGAELPGFMSNISKDQQQSEAKRYADLADFTGLLKEAAEKTGAALKGAKVRFKRDISINPKLRQALLRDADVPLVEEVRNHYNDEYISTNLADQIASFVSALKHKYVFHSPTP